MVRLPTDMEAARPAADSFSWKHDFRQIVNALRIHNVPMLNLCIVAVLGTFLVKLTTKYKELYMKNSLVTIIVTNLVLYGISETLAQSILSFSWDAPGFSFALFRAFSDNPDFARNDLGYTDDPVLSHTNENRSIPQPDLASSQYNQTNLAQSNRTNLDGDGSDIESDDSGVDDEHVDRFLQYLRSDSSLPYQAVDGGNHVTPAYELSYFKFSRLAGFMCWGFVMAFVQSWWYRFLQIYSKHPQFVEVLRKVMSDQFCFSPISLFCFFTYGTMVLENGTWADARAKLSKLYFQTLVINYCVWFPVQFVNFLLIPRDFQVPFSSSISVLWNCFLSMRNSTA